ncbi:BRCA1 C Terminus domain containing protein [Abeliophyllum distichum]|uniref:BRCA1 C Terminus domain containing protein n=1 Tax=Abeliophyllum distichum TaxID=126358 RepID=A0ABD1PB15_9LAMI
MGSISGLRPPQFSEDPAWLPGWLQQCNPQPLSVEAIDNEHTTFQQRVEFLQENISKGESLMDKDGFMIGHLFLSGNDSSPFTWAQSPEHVVQHHLHLSLDGNSEKTTLTTDAYQIEFDHPLAMQPVQNSGVLQGKVDKLSPNHNSSVINLSSMVQLEKPPDKNESSKLEENVKFSEGAANAVELCIAASEALVIHEIIGSDSFMKHSSASTILETTLQVKQARLEVWRNTTNSSINEISEIDHLSDLDDMTMEGAYKDIGIHFDDFHGIQLSVSQVKDTLDSESDENVKYETGAPAIDCGKSSDNGPRNRMGGVLHDGMQVTEDFSLKCFDGNAQKKVKNDSDWGMGSTSVGCHNDCLELVPAEENLNFSTSVENVNVTMEAKDSFQANANFSPTESCQGVEEYNDVSNIVQERFQSRWYGGWTWKQREVKCFAPMKHDIPEPFVGETSFLSESADVAPDENSFVQNQDKRTVAASQSSIPSEDLCNKSKDGVLLSQVAGPSSASFMDPLCSVVPCSISENVCSSALDHDNIFPPRRASITTEHATDNLPRTSASNGDLARGEAVAVAMSSIKESQHTVRRQCTSLRNYSLLPSHSTFLEKEGPGGRSFLIDSNAKLTSLERCYSNCEETAKTEARFPVLQKEKKSSPLTIVLNRGTHRSVWVTNCSTYDRGEENLSKMALPESILECPPSENLQKEHLRCKNQIANPFSASRRVSFRETEINIPEKKKLRRLQTASKTSYSTRSAKKVRRSSPQFESRSQQLKHYQAKYFGEERKRLIFQNMEFMLTGFSHRKEKEIAGLIIKYGGMVLSDIPSPNFRRKRSSRLEPQVLPIVLCLKKLQTIPFLYGCAVMAFILKVDWLTDSIAAGIILPPEKYMILSRNVSGRHIQVVVKHGGGQVFKTLQSLVQNLEASRISTGFVIADENNVSRHLKHCTKEQNISMVSVNWIIKCLYAGNLLSLKEEKNPHYFPSNKLPELRDSMDLSEEI